MSDVSGSPLGVCGKWQVHTAIVKCYSKGIVYYIFNVPIIYKFGRLRKFNVASTSGYMGFQNRNSKGKSRYVAKKT